MEMGLWQRDRAGAPRNGLIHHSDAGSQYTSFRLATHLALEDIAASIGSVGDAYDNAMMESFWGRMQTELLNRHRWRTRLELEYLEVFHNRQRRHSALGMFSPIEYELQTPIIGSVA